MIASARLDDDGEEAGLQRRRLLLNFVALADHSTSRCIGRVFGRDPDHRVLRRDPDAVRVRDRAALQRHEAVRDRARTACRDRALSGACVVRARRLCRDRRATRRAVFVAGARSPARPATRTSSARVADFGKALFTAHLLPFEVTALRADGRGHRRRRCWPATKRRRRRAAQAQRARADRARRGSAIAPMNAPVEALHRRRRRSCSSSASSASSCGAIR